MLFGKKPASGPPVAEPTSPAVGASTDTPLDKDEARKRAIASKQIAAAFGEIVALAMRTQATRHHTLQDLEWLVAPAVLTGQFALAEAQAKTTGLVTPVGAVLWAMVSEETDRRLTAELEAPMRLRPDEWRAGAIPWIVLTLGDQRVVGGLLKQLTETVFKNRAPKLRARSADGRVTVGRLEISAGEGEAGAG
jgi:hemolysin-activating ACP:hemolysin acyltransferase